jgi:protein TonB
MAYRLRTAQPFYRTRRGAILLGIVGLHGVLAFGLRYLSPGERPETLPEPVQVALITEPDRDERPPPPPPPKLEAMPVEVVVPVFQVAADVPAPQSITVSPPRSSTPPPVAAPSDEPITVENVGYLRPPQPRYPAAAKRARAQGTVFVRVLIGPDGKPVEVLVHRSSGSAALDGAACDSVWGASFQPHRENGVPRSVRAIIPVEFSLAVRVAGRSRDASREHGHDRDHNHDHDRGHERVVQAP